MNWWEHYPRELNFTPVVHCSRQMAGFGQKNKAWISDEGSLTFSCILSPQSIATWTPLEVALLCRNFLQEHYHLFCHLKWPNDLVDQNGYKLGGIICHMRNNFVVVGIGLNLFPLTNPLLS